MLVGRAGRLAARRPTGRGCSRSALIRTRGAPDALRAELGTGAAELARSCPSCRRLARAAGADIVDSEPRASACSTPSRSSSAAHPSSGPIVLVLDDLHAADTPSLLLLQFVARELASSRVLVVGAHRDVDPIPSRGAQGCARGADEGAASRARIELAGLSEEDVARVRRARRLPGSRGPASFRRSTTDGGKPSVRRRDRAPPRARADGGTRLHAETIPQSVRDVIARTPRSPVGGLQPRARRSRRCSGASSPWASLARHRRGLGGRAPRYARRGNRCARRLRCPRRQQPPAFRPRPDPRHAVRRPDDGRRVRMHRLAVEALEHGLRRRGRPASRRARAPCDRRQRLRARA